jgi:hypothetical protein
MAVPTVCQPIQDEIEELQEAIRQLQQDLHDAKSTNEKQQIVHEMNRCRQTLDGRRRDLQICIDSTRPPPPPPLLASFTGRVALQVEHPLTPAPFEADIVVPLELGGDDERYRIVRALNPPVLGSRTFPSPLGDVTTTIELELSDGRPASGPLPALPVGFIGFFTPHGLPVGPLPWDPQFSTGTAGLPAGWMQIYGPGGRIHHSLSLGDWFQVDSTFDVFGDTYGGAPMNAAGEIVLFGAWRFADGVLWNRRYTLRIAGTVAPRP